MCDINEWIITPKNLGASTLVTSLIKRGSTIWQGIKKKKFERKEEKNVMLFSFTFLINYWFGLFSIMSHFSIIKINARNKEHISFNCPIDTLLLLNWSRAIMIKAWSTGLGYGTVRTLCSTRGHVSASSSFSFM